MFSTPDQVEAYLTDDPDNLVVRSGAAAVLEVVRLMERLGNDAGWARELVWINQDGDPWQRILCCPWCDYDHLNAPRLTWLNVDLHSGTWAGHSRSLDFARDHGCEKQIGILLCRECKAPVSLPPDYSVEWH